MNCSKSSSDNEGDESPIIPSLPPPLPLYSFYTAESQKSNTLHGEPISSISHIETENDRGERLHCPMHSRKLSRWFTVRDEREYYLRSLERKESSSQSRFDNSYNEFRNNTDNSNLSNGLLYEHLVYQNQAFTLPNKASTSSNSTSTNPYSFNDELNINMELFESYGRPLLKNQINNTSYPHPSSSSSSTSISTSSTLSGDYISDLSFNSDFESGNLDKAIRVHGRSNIITTTATITSSDILKPDNIHNTFPNTTNDTTTTNTTYSSSNGNDLMLSHDDSVPQDVQQEYDLFLRNDIHTGGNTQWYYFSATCNTTTDNTSNSTSNTFTPLTTTQKEESSTASTSTSIFPLKVRFNIVNLYKKDALYNFGMKPVTYSCEQASSNQIGWKHAGEDICYYKNNLKQMRTIDDNNNKSKQKNFYTLSFTYTFTEPDTVYFAHGYPYTYSDLQKYLFQLEQDINISTFFRRKVLCQTLANNTCDVITITSRSADPIAVAHRPAIVISSRVHPGESNASYAMHGVIDFLIGNSIEAKELRETFVFKLIPMLNPDGVVHGNYRCSLAGTDLNRCYSNPDPILHPTIFAMKELLKSIHQSNGVLLCIDLHGHSRKKNSFLFGSDINLQSKKHTEEIEDQVQNNNLLPEEENYKVGKEDEDKEECLVRRSIYCRIFPYVLHMTTPSGAGGYFSLRDCSFRVQSKKNGTGRVVGWEELGIEGYYTLEISFCGNGDNRDMRLLKQKIKKKKKKKKLENSDKESNMMIDTVETDDISTVSTADDHHDQDQDHQSDNETFQIESNIATNIKDNNIDIKLKLEEISSSYKSATHYTQRDLKNIGRDVCLSFLHYCNKTSISLPHSTPPINSDLNVVTTVHDSSMSIGSSSMSIGSSSMTSSVHNTDDINDSPNAASNSQTTIPEDQIIELIPPQYQELIPPNSYFPFSRLAPKIEMISPEQINECILRPAIFPADILMIRDLNPIVNNTLNNHWHCSTSNSLQPFSSLRLQSEIFIRKTLHGQYLRRRSAPPTSTTDVDVLNMIPSLSPYLPSDMQSIENNISLLRELQQQKTDDIIWPDIQSHFKFEPQGDEEWDGWNSDRSDGE